MMAVMSESWRRIRRAQFRRAALITSAERTFSEVAATFYRCSLRGTRCRHLEREPGGERVIAERLDGVEREFAGGAAAERRQLLEHIGGCRDDVAAHEIGF